VNVVVLLAGIADPKFPLQALRLGPDGAVAGDDTLPRVLSPFDEAALETALQLRDADPAVKITAFLPGGPQSEQLLRVVAAFRLDRVFGVDYRPTHRWDVSQLARTLKYALDATETRPELALIGREFGDSDDGALPPYLAEAWGWRFAGLAQEVARTDGDLMFRRGRGEVDEWLTLPVPAIASVTNDKSNRLRHPLLKNVIAAKSATFTVVSPIDPGAAPRLSPSAVTLSGPTVRQGAGCRILAGPVESQVAELAGFLRQWRDIP
jgi:electron transfer flavoprotein beta subunit